MPRTDTHHETLIWTDAPRAALIEQVAQRVEGLSVLAVGGPRKAEVKPLAESLDAEPYDDLRKMLVDRPGSSLVLGTMDGARLDDLRQAVEQGADVLALEPPCDENGRTLRWERGQEPAGRLVHAPMLRLSPAWLSAADPQQVLGRLCAVSLALLGPAEAGSLFTRLYDAMDWIVSTLGIPQGIEARLTGPLSEPPENPTGLTGRMTAHLHFSDGASATLLAADRAAVWSRQMSVVGESGQLLMDDRGYQIFAAGADEADAAAVAPNDPVELIARQWRWMIDHRMGPERIDLAGVLASCRAALLSARTGETESPDTFMKLT